MYTMKYKDFECGISEWIENTLGLKKSQIFWKNQNQPQPKYPYVALIKSNVRPVGIEELRTITDDNGDQCFATVGLREIQLSVEAFADDKSGALDPDTNAFALLSTLIDSTLDMKTLEYFCAAKAAFVEEQNPILDISSVISGKYVSRAIVDLKFRVLCVRKHGEEMGCIETVKIRSVCGPLSPYELEVTSDKEI